MRTPLLPLSTIGTLALAAFLIGCTAQQPPSGTDSGEPAVMEKAEADHILVMPADIEWADAPAVLPAGAKIAVLKGDPTKAGPFTMRLKVPAQYRVPPHFHPVDEHVTVISGDFSLGMGEAFDAGKMDALPVGGFAMMKKGVKHYAWSSQGAVVQLHGIGPWGLTYVNPEDDPRNATP